jgi:hypothetical protein
VDARARSITDRHGAVLHGADPDAQTSCDGYVPRSTAAQRNPGERAYAGAHRTRSHAGQQRAGRRPTGAGSPAFALNDATGQTMSLTDLQGQPVVMVFWALWCGHCQNEMLEDQLKTQIEGLLEAQ